MEFTPAPIKIQPVVRPAPIAFGRVGTSALAPGEVDLWCFFYEQALEDAALRARYEALMSPDERARHRRFRFEKDRRLFLATRGLVRSVLSRYRDGDPAEWRFAFNAHGRPYLPDVDDLCFNLSNTAGLVVCALSRREIGVDAEDVERRSETLAVADRFFSRDEVRALRALPVERQRERFFSYWTLKESYIKARGMGLAIPLGQFSFELDGGADIRVRFDPRLADDPARWQFRLLQASPRHLVALAHEGPMSLRALQFTP